MSLARMRARVSARVRAWVRACVRVHACSGACMRARVRTCVCALWEINWCLCMNNMCLVVRRFAHFHHYVSVI